MDTYVFVICVVLTAGCVLSLGSGFKRIVIEPEVRMFNFSISLGLVIWGWLVYF
jgi:hypothetical protein